METITYTREDLMKMSNADINELLSRDDVKMSGTVVVRDEDGNIKYDNPDLAGTFGENNA